MTQYDVVVIGGGYCMSKIADMLINEYHMKPEEIRYRSEGSQMYAGEVK